MKLLLVAVALAVAACASGAERPNNPDAGTEPIDACVPAAGERCNQQDDDCDGLVDEDWPMQGEPCSMGDGVCRDPGVFQCIDSEDDVACDAVAGAPSTEMCDGMDNDCDGMVDEDFNVGSGCDGDDADACLDGMTVCNGAGGTRCTDVAGTTAETCDTIDNDCDMAIDETYPIGDLCTLGIGGCAREGMLQCNAATDGTVCDAVVGAPLPETCGNGIDEDCTGADLACPANDIAAGAVDVTGGGSFVGNLAVVNDNNWIDAPGCGAQGGRDLFYQFTLPAQEVVYWDTFQSNFDSVVRLYDGACAALGGLLECTNDACTGKQSQGARDLAAGTYCLVVDQAIAGATTGTLRLNIIRGGRSGSPLPNRAGSVTGDTTGKLNLATSTCEPRTAQPDDGWYFTTCPGTARVAADTCDSTGRDTVLTVRRGNAASGTVTACDDDGCSPGDNGIISNHIFSTTATLGWLIVDGFESAAGLGPYKLDYTLTP